MNLNVKNVKDTPLPIDGCPDVSLSGSSEPVVLDTGTDPLDGSLPEPVEMPPAPTPVMPPAQTEGVLPGFSYLWDIQAVGNGISAKHANGAFFEGTMAEFKERMKG